MTDLPTAWELQETVYSRNREIAELDNEIKSMATTIAALRATVERQHNALENVRLFAQRVKMGSEERGHILRFCREGGAAPSPMRREKTDD